LLKDETPICRGEDRKEEIEEVKLDIKNEYGTITEFYFMLSLSVNTLLIPVFKRFEELV